jgi:ubiquinol-cytochrome c reductase cytochrome c subunit
MPTRRRAHRILAAVPVVAAVALTPLFLRPAHGQEEEGENLLAQGGELYATQCASCHGPEGEGVDPGDATSRGPSLQSSGEAAAYYYLSTGRMPLANSEEQPRRKDRAFDDEEMEALVAYVGSLGEGPDVPDVDIEGADLAAGGEIFRGNCQACHSASGSGGALSYGRAAPRLAPASPTEAAAAVRIGPGQMPVFGRDIVSDEELNDLIAYVQYLDEPSDPGGLPIGRTGPIPEGFVAWLVGVIGLLVLVAWIGTFSPIRRRRT